MSDTPAIQTVGLTKDYGDFRALKGLDLEVRRGEVLRTVILPNRSGDRDPADAPGVPV